MLKGRLAKTILTILTITISLVIINSCNQNNEQPKLNDVQKGRLKNTFTKYLKYRGERKTDSLFLILPPFFANHMCHLENVHNTGCESFRSSFAKSYTIDSICGIQVQESMRGSRIYVAKDSIVAIITTTVRYKCNDCIPDKTNCDGGFLYYDMDMFYISNDYGITWWVVDDTDFSQDNPAKSPLYDAFKSAYSEEFVKKIFHRYYGA